MSKDSGVNPYSTGEVYTDTGTGAYEGPPAEVTYGAEHDPEPTGAHPGPPVSVTVESPPEHLSKPTGAVPGPPASVTYTQHPAVAPEDKPVEAKTVRSADVEDKAVKTADRKGGR
jgi:hypothetical protein